MIAFIALTVLAIALLPAWSPDLRAGTVIARFFNRTSEILRDIGYANRRIRELQLGPVDPSTTDHPTTRRTARAAFGSNPSSAVPPATVAGRPPQED